MKKLLVAILAVAFMTSPAFASHGGKKKSKKKAGIECKKDQRCDVKNCDPSKCDPTKCDPSKCNPNTCHFRSCSQKSSSTASVENKQ